MRQKQPVPPPLPPPAPPWDDAGVVTALYVQGHGLPGFQGHGLLGQGNGRGRLHAQPEEQRHPVGNAAQYPSGVVGGRNHPAIRHGEGVVRPGTGHARQSEAVPEFQALHGGDGIKNRSQTTLHSAEHGGPQSGRQTGDGALNDPAHAVARTAGSQNMLLHRCPSSFGQYRESLWDHFRGNGVKGPVMDPGNGIDMRPDVHAFFCKPLFA